MKMRFLIAGLIAGWLTLAVHAADLDIEFVGVVVTGPNIRVALVRRGDAPQWVSIGQRFGEFAVESYGASPDVVILSKDGQQFRLVLKEAKVVPGVIEPSPEIKKAILSNLRQLGAWADQYYLENGKMTATLAEIIRTNPKVMQMMSLEPLAGEDYSQIKFEQGKPISVTTSGGFTISHKP